MKVAVLGAGAMGETVISHLKNLGSISRIVAYEPKQERINELQTKGVFATDDLESILRDEKLPLVFITSPNNSHYDLAIRSMQYGKAVMCEKPMANDLADAAAMVAFAEKNNAWLQIGFELRYSLLYMKVKEWIDAGLLGNIANVSCQYIISARKKDSWRNKKKYCGCLFGEKLSHYVDLPRWWTGDEVERVFTCCAPNTVPYFETRDNYHTICNFTNGAVSHLTYMSSPAAHFAGDPLQTQNVLELQQGDGHQLRYLIVGSKGAAETSVFDRSIKRWEFSDSPDYMISTLVENITWDESKNHFYFHNTHDQTLDIVDRIAKGLPPKNSASDSLETMKLCFAAEESADIGKPVLLKEKKISR